MKKIYIIALAALAAISSSCGRGSGGELVGVRNKKLKNNKVPLGMVYIPAGTFIMGQTDQDITFAQIAQNKQVTVQAFYMDETEVTNSEYRQFVNWVRDSIAVTKLDDPKLFIKTKGNGNANAPKYIDWKKVGNGSAIWSGGKKNSANANKLQDMYYQGNDRIFDRNEIDVRRLKYKFAFMKLREAANFRGNPNKTRQDFIINDEVAVYPDTLVWLADFSYAQNEPLVEGYFSHPAFDNYPVVGVNWRQSRAFTVWRTRLYEGYAHSRKMPRLARLPFELPTEAEFEYAARGGRVGNDYPWGGPYIRNAKGCLMANFKPGRGNYIDDGGAFTVNVKSYFPNDFGLYNMSGNVAEWTASAYDESASTFVHDLNPTFNYEANATDPEVMKRKVVRGGSWKDIGYFLQNSTRSFEYQDTAKSYVGFRCVTHFPGRDIKDKR
jgi:gliding motility-associated lipoprotein GldK